MRFPTGIALGVAKALTLVFWWLVLSNLFSPFPELFSPWISLAGIGLLLLHVLELLVFHHRLKGRTHRWADRLQVLVLGIFHVYALRPTTTAAPG
jgi:putative membrane protein